MGVGWQLHSYYNTSVQSEGAAWARRAAIAHVVYSPEVRHPVEVAANEEAHLVRWLSKRLGIQLKVPHLGALGYSLVGGRLLPFGRLPGDIVIERGNSTFYFPIVTSIVLSVVISLILFIIGRFR